MKIFLHHLYEYKKGLQRLVLHTTAVAHREAIEKKLTDFNISHVIAELTPSKINVFFGDSDCIEVIRSLGHHDLPNITNEQDIFLGALLGYDLILQSKRYHKGKNFDACTEYFPNNLLFPESERVRIYAS